MRVRSGRLICLVMTMMLAWLLFMTRETTLTSEGLVNSYYNEVADSSKDDALLLVSQASVFSGWRQTRQQADFSVSAAQTCRRFAEVATYRTCVERQNKVRGYCARRLGASQGGDVQTGQEDAKKSGTYSQGDDKTSEDHAVDILSYQTGSTMLMFCSIHKVASTYWVRIFRFLHKDSQGRAVPNPQSISKREAHLAPFTSSRKFALDYVTRKLKPGVRDFRFMFAREPYHRLWAVYIDKFVLPDDFFWSHHGWLMRYPSIPDSFPCLNISFEEFVRYAVKGSTYLLPPHDDHMLPVTRVCDPCILRPHFVGHFETLVQDARDVLKQFSLTGVTPEVDFKLQVLNQMRTLTQFVYETVAEQRHFRCVTHLDLQNRLVRAFILNGYLPPRAAEVSLVPTLQSMDQLINLMQGLFITNNRSQTEVSRQKEGYFRRAYRSLPLDLLRQVRRFYSEDFQAFGYDPEPEKIFKL